MGKFWLRLIVVFTLLLLPFAIHWLYRSVADHEGPVRIATGYEGGRYGSFGSSLAAKMMKTRADFRVVTVPTGGSLDNLRRLRNKQVEFCIYQHGATELHRRFMKLASETSSTESTKNQSADPSDKRTETVQSTSANPEEDGNEVPSSIDNVRFVTNLYSEVCHLIVRRDLEFNTAHDLEGKVLSLGRKDSGEYVISRLLLSHLGLDESMVQARYFSYSEVRSEFASGDLDAAIITSGVSAPILRQLLGSGQCKLVDLPYVDALAKKQLSLSSYKIPAGYFQTHGFVEPQADIQTVAVRAQLLTRVDVPAALVEEVITLVSSEAFLAQNDLPELFTEGKSFAREKPEFPLHAGALHYFDPGLRPLLNTDFVEATEGIRSFIVSMLIALYLGFRWVRGWRIKQQEHRMDRHIHQLLQIERNQLALDEGQENLEQDIRTLQKLLDDVTELRQEALHGFSAHELSEDRAADCFLQMCHALSDKINAKLSRQRLDKALGQLATDLAQKEQQPEETS